MYLFALFSVLLEPVKVVDATYLRMRLHRSEVIRPDWGTNNVFRAKKKKTVGGLSSWKRRAMRFLRPSRFPVLATALWDDDGRGDRRMVLRTRGRGQKAGTAVRKEWGRIRGSR